MAARKSTRKTAAKKATRRKAARKKTAPKKSARKKTARRKAPRKKATRKKSAAARGKAAVARFEAELPKSLKGLSAQLRRDLNKIEKEIETAQKNTRRSLARIVRDASHYLGTLEARGDREWRKRSKKAEADVQRIVKRMQKALA